MSSTTIRVPVEFRERLRKVSEERNASLVDTLRDALELLRREEFYRAMARWEDATKREPGAWDDYVTEAQEWSGDLADLRTADQP